MKFSRESKTYSDMIQVSPCRWNFAQENSLLLPDEYDRIHLDLAPFWALPRAEMRKRVRHAMDVKETFVLVVDNGTVSVEVHKQLGSSLHCSLSNACYVIYRS